MKKISLLLLITFLSILSGCSNTTQDYFDTNINTSAGIVSQEIAPKYTNYVTIKYRSDPVDIAGFEALDTSNSSLVRGSWYDVENQYMVIDLNGVKYHYCRFPSSIWNDFKSADSFGTYYKSYIKGDYDCRNGGVPSY